MGEKKIPIWCGGGGAEAKIQQRRSRGNFARQGPSRSELIKGDRIQVPLCAGFPPVSFNNPIPLCL